MVNERRQAGVQVVPRGVTRDVYEAHAYRVINGNMLVHQQLKIVENAEAVQIQVIAGKRAVILPRALKTFIHVLQKDIPGVIDDGAVKFVVRGDERLVIALFIRAAEGVAALLQVRAVHAPEF